MKKKSLVAICLCALAAVLYLASLAHYAYPGESARLMALWLGLDAGGKVEYPLMAFFARLLGGGNLLAPICGAISVFAIYSLVSTFVARWMTKRTALGADAEDGYTSRGKERVLMIAGGVAAVVFMFTPAVRSAATHLEPRLFDFTWMLLPFLLAIPFYSLKRGAVWVYAPLAGAIAGLGLCDSALALAFLPFVFASVFFVARAQGRRPYLALALNFFVAVAVARVAMAVFGLDMTQHLVALKREMRLWILIPGWLFVALFTTLPFLVSIFSARRSLSENAGLVQWLFHLALTFVAVLAIATSLSPSSLMEPYGVLPVATSAFAACVAGYLAAFWWINRRAVVALVAGGAFAFVLVVTCLWNLFEFDGDRGAFADKVAQRVIEDLGDRDWIVTDGALDDHLRIVAAKTGKELHIVSLARDLDKDYLKSLAALVERTGLGGKKNAELRASLTLGVLPFIQDWFASDPAAKKLVAVWGAPDLWVSANIKPVPEFLFFGADESRVPDWTAWKAFDAILKAPKGWGSYHAGTVENPVDRLRLSLRRHVGFVANNRGVWLQDKHRDDDAWKMYELVLNEIDRDNICTIFNEMAMIDAKHPAAVAKKRDLERILKGAVDDSNRRYVLWRLGSYYGYIRDPEVFIRLGHVWAKSGRPGDALSQIRRAIDFVPTEKRSALLNMMAALYANENDPRKSRGIYESILEKNAEDHDALIGLMRLELSEGRTEKAIQYLERAVAVADGKRKQVESAMLAMMKDDMKGAAARIREAINADAKDLQAWSMLAAVTLQQAAAAKDAKEKAALMKKLETDILPSMEKQAADPKDYHVQTTKGFMLLQKDDADSRKEARDAFAIAAQSRPDVAATQDLVLGLDISLADQENAEQHAKEVLRRNRNAPLANYVMGSIAFGRGDLAEAELFLRKAADAQQPVALAQNDLAEILRRAGKLEEAEAYARRAVAAAPNLYVAWETLGSVILSKKGGDFSEAEACVRKACELSKEANGREADVRMLVSLARVQIKSGDVAHAKVTIRKIRGRISELSDFEKKEFEEVAKQVK